MITKSAILDINFPVIVGVEIFEKDSMKISFFPNNFENKHIGIVAKAPVEITTSGFSFIKIMNDCIIKINNLITNKNSCLLI